MEVNKSDYTRGRIEVPEFEFEPNDKVRYKGRVQVVSEIVYRKYYDSWFYKINQFYITKSSAEKRFDLIEPSEAGDNDE
ncbi:hypothetical protein [Haloarcula quadrata]|uniref:hypothetical protein n=1 Tax=Haloarcula quadrata TaxID=182779 RepID=UPI000EAE893D|nr:hypothetical protein [Haloarcula quadrata]